MKKRNWVLGAAALLLMMVTFSFAQAPQYRRPLYQNALTGNSDNDFATLANSGGVFISSGWQANKIGGLALQLKNRLPAVGSLEIEITNFNPATQVLYGKQTIIGMTSRPYSRLSLFYEDTTSAFFYLRSGIDYLNGDKCNLEFDPAFEGVYSRTDYRDIFVANKWDIAKTYQFKFVWDHDYIWVYIDGQMMKKLEFKGPIERFQYVTMGGDEIYRGIPGPIYSNLKIYTAETAVRFSDKTFVKNATGLIVPRGGHGIAIADVNADGLDDIYISNFLAGTTLRDILYIQQPNHAFADETAARTGPGADGGSYSALLFDADNDGDLDLFCCRIDAPNRLFINNGQGNFTDEGTLRGIASSMGRTSAAVAFDADKDGDIDLLAVNQNSKHEMYINNGDGHFTLQDRGFKAGLGVVKNDDMPSVTAADVDRDGDSDIYINWPKAANELYINSGSGVFSEKAAQYNVAYAQGSQGAVFADFDKDGDADLFLASKVEAYSSDSLFLNIYRNDGAGNFSIYAPAVRPVLNGYSQLLFDADNDGHLDVYSLQNNQFDRLCKGRRDYNYYRTSMAKLYLGNGAGGFTFAGDSGADIVGADARSCVADDFDQDGDLDLFVTNAKLENVFLENTSTLKNNWLEVTVIGPKGDWGGIGSRIWLYNSGHLEDNAFLLAYDEVVSQSGYLSANTLRRHFGLGSLGEVDIKVVRVDGSVQRRSNVAVNQRLLLMPVTEAAPVAEFSGTPLSGTKPLNVQFTSQSSGSITACLWTFGDGGTSTEASPAHSYADAGSYTVTLTVTGPGGSGSKTRTDCITVTEAAPVAEFSGTPLSGTKPLNVQFTSQSAGSITAYLWTFGDGGTSTEASPAHSYADAGSYTVTLMVTGPGGSGSKTRTDCITVTEAAPVAEFSGTPLSGNKPLNVQFTSQSSGIITACLWTFGDGGTSTEASPAHSYADAGSYTVTLTVTGPGGSGSKTRTDCITVTEAAPVAKFSSMAASDDEPFTIRFTDQSAGAIISRFWNFGDSTSSTELNPVYTYQSVGTYAVSLTVTGPGGSDTEIKSVTIEVKGPNQPPRFTLIEPADSVISISPGWQHRFHVDVFDPDGDSINYAWFCNGLPVGNNSSLSVYTSVNTVITVRVSDQSNTIEQTWRLVNIIAEVAKTPAPDNYRLEQNFPNPANPTTMIEFQLPKLAEIEVTIYNESGQLVRSLLAGQYPPGTHRLVWDGRSQSGQVVPTGIYYYVLQTDAFRESKKLLLVK